MILRGEMHQKGKYEQVNLGVNNIPRGRRGHGREQGQETRSPRRWGGGAGGSVGKETFFVFFVCSVLTSFTVLWFIKFLTLFVIVSPIPCCLRLRIDLVPSLPFAVI